MFDDKDVAEITRNILIALGVEVQKGNNLLFYQDSKSPIFFESHPVKANINPNLALFTDKDDGKYKLIIKFEDGSQYEGNWYINKIICFDEAIFNIDGTFSETDLYPYDVDQSMWGIDE